MIPKRDDATPRVVAWETTRRCPMQCKHCRGAARDTVYHDELDTEEARRLIDGLAAYAPLTLILTGGEPMYRDDIYECARYAADRGLRVAMAPCGALIDRESVGRMKRAGVQQVSISLDGACAASHDAFRGVPGAFDTAIAALRLLREGGMPFQINTTVTRENSGEQEAIVDLCLELGAQVYNPFFLVPVGRGRAIADLALSPEQYEDTLRWIATAASARIATRVTCAPHYGRVARQLGRGGGPSGRRAVSGGCLAGRQFVFVSYDGHLQPCGFLDIDCGDLRAASFDFRGLYESSPVFNDLRDRGRYGGKCGVCEFVNVCGGCRARAYALSGDYMAEEPFCTYRPGAVGQGSAHGHD